MDPGRSGRIETDIEKIQRLRDAMYSRERSDHIASRERRVLSNSYENVPDDWQRTEEGVPEYAIAPRGITAARTVLWWTLGAAVVFFITAFLFFVYYFAIGGGAGSASTANVDIAIGGPQTVQPGQSSELQIAVTNRNREPLQLADLIMTFPDGTRSVTDFQSVPQKRYPLGTIAPGDTKQGVINAVFSGKAGDHATVKVELEYHLSGSNAIFAASRSYDLVFSSSPLGIAIDGNTQTTSGQPVQLQATVNSNGNSIVRSAFLSITYPFGFKYESSDPSPQFTVGSTVFWSLGDLTPGKSRKVMLRGTLVGEQGDDRVFHMSAGLDASATSSQLGKSLADNMFHIGISQPFLGITVSAGSETSGDTSSGASSQGSQAQQGSFAIGGTGGAASRTVVVHPGDTINVTIAYQNNLPVAVSDAVVVARLAGIAVDGTTVHSSNGFYRSADSTMLWDKTTFPDLTSLPSGARGKLSFTLQIPTSDALKNTSKPYLDISVNAGGTRLSESSAPQNLQSAASIRIALATDLQLFGQALYYESPFSGNHGPIPPKTNTETAYALVFTVRNSTNKITDAKLTATLPPYVRWLGSFAPSSEHFSFNQANSTLTWDIGDIAPNTGLNGSASRLLAISIGLTPSESQIGSKPILAQQVTLTGTDAATGASISRPLVSEITTDLLKVVGSNGAPAGSVATDKGFSATNATVVK